MCHALRPPFLVCMTHAFSLRGCEVTLSMARRFSHLAKKLNCAFALPTLPDAAPFSEAMMRMQCCDPTLDQLWCVTLQL